jgi:hypothetical protein
MFRPRELQQHPAQVVCLTKYCNSNIQENAERDGLPRSTTGYAFAWLMLDGSARWVDVRRERQRSGEVVGD